MVESKSEKFFNGLNYFLLGVFGFITLYPFWYVIIASFSSGNAVISGKVLVFPVQMTLDAYKEVMSTSGLWVAYGNSFFITGMGTLVNMLVTVSAAYALSKARLRGKTFFTVMVVLTMWFNPGIIPVFLNIRSLGLYNTRTAIILGFAVIPLYLIIMRTFFQSIPDSLEESAKMDGASDIHIMLKIFIPLSKPALATIGLYYAVSRWNGFFWIMVLIRDKSKLPLQVLLKEIIVEMKLNDELVSQMDAYSYSRETLIYAMIVIAVIPVLIAYPLLQRYVVKGVMVGAVKG